MNNKLFSIVAAFAAVAVIELFQWEILPGAFQIESSGYAAGALTAETSGVQAYSLLTEIERPAPNGGDVNSKDTASVLDPVTMILLGSGMVGLAGLARRKV